MPVTCSHLQSVGTPKGWEWACTLSPLLPLLSLSLWVCVRGDSACSRGGREDPIACTGAALGVAGGSKHCLRRVMVSGLPAGLGGGGRDGAWALPRVPGQLIAALPLALQVPQHRPPHRPAP